MVRSLLPVMPSEEIFGTRLRLERERRGVSLETVAVFTKVSQSLFAEMERGDFARWPPGIFGRAFIRGYAEAVGLDPDTTVVQFLALFPSDDVDLMRSRPGDSAEPTGGVAWADEFRALDVEPESGAIDANPHATLRLVLAEDEAQSRWRQRANRSSLRLGAAALDVTVVLVGAAVVAMFAGAAAFWKIAAIGSLSVAALSSLALGGSPALWYLRRRLRPADRIEAAPLTELTPVRRLGQDLIVSPKYYRPTGDRRYDRSVRHA